MNSLLVRVTETPELDKDGMFEFFRGFQVVGCREHPHDNPHYHFWVLSKVKHDTFQRKLKSIEGIASKFTVKAGDGRLDYMCKGPKAVSKLKAKDYPGVKVVPEIVINTMEFTEKQIEEAHEEWWQKAQELLGDKKKSKKVIEENKSKENWFHTLVHYCENDGVVYNSDGWKIAQSIIKAYQLYIKCEPNDFQIKSYAKSIQRHLVYEHSKQSDDKVVWDRYTMNRAKAIIGSEWTSV